VRDRIHKYKQNVLLPTTDMEQSAGRSAPSWQLCSL